MLFLHCRAVNEKKKRRILVFKNGKGVDPFEVVVDLKNIEEVMS